MVIVVGNGYGGLSSNPERDTLHSANTLEKGMNPTRIVGFSYGYTIGDMDIQ